MQVYTYHFIAPSFILLICLFSRSTFIIPDREVRLLLLVILQWGTGGLNAVLILETHEW